MKKFEQYLEAVRNEDDSTNRLMDIIKKRMVEEKRSADGVYHYFNDIQKGAIVAYDPKIFREVGRRFETLYKTYLKFHGLSEVELIPATKKDGIPEGFIGWKWGEVEDFTKKLQEMVENPADMSGEDVTKIAELLEKIPTLDNTIVIEINKILLRHRQWRGGAYRYIPMSMSNVEKIAKLLQKIPQDNNA